MYSFLFRKYRGFLKKNINLSKSKRRKKYENDWTGKNNESTARFKNKIIVIVFTCARLVKNIICYTHAQNTIINNLF